MTPGCSTRRRRSSTPLLVQEAWCQDRSTPMASLCRTGQPSVDGWQVPTSRWSPPLRTGPRSAGSVSRAKGTLGLSSDDRVLLREKKLMSCTTIDKCHFSIITCATVHSCLLVCFSDGAQHVLARPMWDNHLCWWWWHLCWCGPFHVE